MKKVIKNGQLVNVFTREILPWQVLIEDGVIIDVGEEVDTTDADICNADGMYLVPGLISAHDHCEMVRLWIRSYGWAVLMSGTTAAIMGPHDIVNTMGMEGMRELIRDSTLTPFKPYYTVPPCVPSAPLLEDAQGRVTLEDVKQALKFPRIKGLAEAMDFNGILSSDPVLNEILDWARREKLFVDGHCPGLVGERLSAYIAKGIRTDHESVELDEQLEKLRKGMKVILRRGSTHEPTSAKDLVDRCGDTSNLMLAVDGCINAGDMIRHGHMSWAVRQIINEGVDPLVAIQMATINVANTYGLHDLGAISPGRSADILYIDTLKRFRVFKVIVNGEFVNQPTRQYWYTPEKTTSTIHLRGVALPDFAVKTNQEGPVLIRAIGLIDGELSTEELHLKVLPSEGEIKPSSTEDILKVAVIDRYGHDTLSVGFVRGFGLKSGAFGGSVAQDTQNIVVVGTNDQDMTEVVSRIVDIGGGLFFVDHGSLIASVHLPIAGIMTNCSVIELAAKEHLLVEALRAYGCTLSDPLFMLSLSIALAVIPELKLTNRGLVHVTSGKFVSLFV